MSPKPNNDIRLYARRNLIPNYQLAAELGYSVSGFYRRLQTELSDSEKKDIISLIDKLAKQG